MLFPYISMLFPIFVGIAVLAAGKRLGRGSKLACVISAAAVACVCVIVSAVTRTDEEHILLSFSDLLKISFRADGIAHLFAAVTCVIWVIVAVYSIGYMKHEEHEDIFYGFMLITLGVLIALYFADNLLTLYIFFELATLASMPLVLSSRTREAIAAAQKYLFYSIGGAFLALFGVIVLYSLASNGYPMSGDAVVFGVPHYTLPKDGLTLAAVFLMIIGFGTKAGMYPMHGWLPTAHPVAPSPASALLSGLIAEAGFFAVVRVTKYLLPAGYLDGTWVQYAWLGLALLTVFLGSMMAYREKHIKRRLAYSTVSQVSYMMTGLACGSSVAFYGALLHYVFHAVIKSALFMSAGSVIQKTGRTDVTQLEGVGKDMPFTLLGYTLASLGLIGIPPACGFFSKYYLCTGALAQDGIWLTRLVPVVLIISALLTAGYLLPLAVRGFFPNKDYAPVKRETSPVMYLPILLLGILTFAASLISGSIINLI